ncbi:MAG: hypothetical protein ACE5H4_06105 [Candidatus Thorarchaeota archaeon]
MGKGLALFGLILIILGILPLILNALVLLPEIAAYFYMLNIYSIDLGGYIFSELMLILLGLGIILLIVGAAR